MSTIPKGHVAILGHYFFHKIRTDTEPSTVKGNYYDQTSTNGEIKPPQREDKPPKPTTKTENKTKDTEIKTQTFRTRPLLWIENAINQRKKNNHLDDG